MIKQNGTVLVHRTIMRERVNWQPSVTKTDFRVEENRRELIYSIICNPLEFMSLQILLISEPTTVSPF